MTEQENIVAAGGCFPAGTKINTPIGYRLIEDIREGDEVYAFSLANREPGMPDEQPGQVFVKKVTERFRHYVGEVGETTKLLKITYHGEPEHGYVHDGELIVSGNHYVLTPSRQSEDTDPGFARADALVVGDVLWTEYGDQVIITSIEDGGEYDFVYNFEVEDLHTYIAGGIRVHNGGGGKKKGGGKQSDNSIQSKQIVRVLLSPGEGEIGGLWKSDDISQSVFFDGTPLKNADGTYNFNNIAVDQRVGLPDQTVIPGFSAVESEILVGIPLTAATPLTRTVSDADVDAVRITLEFTQGLQKIDTGNGNANGTSVAFQIQRRPAGGTWETVLTPTVKEMSSGPFTVAGIMSRPDVPGLWDFRVIRTTPDHTDNNIIDDVSLDSYTEIQNANIPYNDRALVAIAVGADSTGGRIPAIALDIKGKLVRVPSNYNPETRVYNGAWDGQFSPTLQWTDNPAWVIYDLCYDDRYGLAAYGFDPSRLDVYSFYEAARYCDELVPTAIGSGKFEPRFTFNAQLMVRESAFHTLNSIASTMNAKLYEHNGFIRIAQDRPSTPGRLITNSNVVDGAFVYSSSSSEETYTQVNVTFSNPDSNFLPTTVSEVASVADRARYKNNSTDLAAYGATSEGQARRAAKWVLDTSLRQSSIVSFDVSLSEAWFEPNEIFLLMDKDYSQTTQEGRLLSANGTTLVLDKPVTITGGSWTISVYSANGETIEERTITSTGTTASVTINSPVTAGADAVYIISGAVKPRQFRLVSMTDNGDGTYAVTGLQHDPNKYARVEQGIIIPDDVYWQQPQLTSVDTPSNLQVLPQTAVNADGQVYRYLQVSWTPPADGTAVSYQFQWRRNGGELVTELPATAFITVQADFSGVYEFFVTAINANGVASPTLAASYNFDFEGGSGGNIDAITGLRLANGADYFNGNMSVVWNPPASGKPKDYYVTLSNAGGGIPFKEFYTTEPGFVYTYEQNVADGGPRPAIQVTVYARDMLNKTGQGVAALFSSQPSAGITNLQVRGGGTVFDTLDLEVTWESKSASQRDYTADPDFAYFDVQVKNGNTVSRERTVTDASFTYTFNDNVKDNGQDNPSNAITIVVTAYNKIGVASASAQATFTPVAPPVVTNLYVKGRTDTTFAEDDLNIVWKSVTSLGKPFSASNQFKHFEVKVYNGTSLKRTEKVFSEFYSYTSQMNAQDNGGNPTPTVRIEVRTFSVYNKTSAPAEATFSNPPPALPLNIQITSGIGNYKVYFDRHVEWDVEGTFVWASTTPNFTPSATNLVATMTGNYLSINAEPGIKYFVKIAPYDSFRRTFTNGVGLNISTEVGVTGEAAGIMSYETEPVHKEGEDAYINSTEKRLYTWDGTKWVVVPNAADIADAVADATVESIDASKITGLITDNQIAGLSAVKLSGKVTKTQISDNAIDTPQLVAGSVKSTTIAAGQVQAVNIGAGAVTSEKVLVTSRGQALNVDPHLEDIAGAWTVDTGITIGTNATAAGASGKNFFNAATTAARDKRVMSTQAIAIDSQKTYRGSAKLFANADVTSNMHLVIDFYDNAGARLVTSPNWGGTYSGNLFSGIPATRGAFVDTGASFGFGTDKPIPAAARTAKIGVWFQWAGNGTGAGQQAAQNIRIERMNGGELIVDGSIIATKIAAEAVTAEKITSDAIVARHIKAGEISTDHMKVNSILGDRITVNTLVGDRIKVGTLDGDALIANSVDAVKIDTRGLTIKDANDNILFGAGTTVPINLMPSETLNSNVTPAGIGALSSSSTVPLSLIPSGALNSNVTAAAIGALPSSFKITANNLSTYIANAAIGGSVLADGVIVTRHMIANSISGDRIQAGTLSGDKIVANSITSGKIAAESISGDQLQVRAVSAKNIASNTITGSHIAAGSLTAREIAADALTVGNASITEAKIASAAVSSLKIKGNAVTVPISSYTAATVSGGSEFGIQDARMVVTAEDLAGVSSVNIFVWFGCHCYSNYHQALTLSLDYAREYDGNDRYVFNGFTRIFSQGGGNNTTQMQGEGMEGGGLSQRVTQPGTYLFRMHMAAPGNTAWASKRYITLQQAKR